MTPDPPAAATVATGEQPEGEDGADAGSDGPPAIPVAENDPNAVPENDGEGDANNGGGNATPPADPNA